jgi:(1->4)-alpha-D-glucan 1-alpha-D-glucosylmutase
VELRATYRLQLTDEFGFADARALVPYLRDLGISHLYLSPSLQAQPGSMHGYDVIDPTRLSDALGGDAGFHELAEAALDAGLGIVLDTVPNHMAATDENLFWEDPDLRRQFFDIDAETGRHRRFFDVDALAGLRQEDPEVFGATHAVTLRLIAEGLVDGLRIDHPDGLADPSGYLRRLHDRGAPRIWVEKILEHDEQLRADWPVTGTVGYEFLNEVCALFVDPDGEAPLTDLWERCSGDRRSFHEWALDAKREQANGPFAPELERLGRLAPELSADVLRESVAALEIYRTYIDPLAGEIADADRAALAPLPPEVAERLLGRRAAPPEFTVRFQQTTPAIMAKGVEDTAFYRYCRLLALNDVGGDPDRFGLPVERFHAANVARHERHPEGLLATTTHDTKRSGDTRARIGALSGMASEWAAAVDRWLTLTDGLRSTAGAPDDIERLFLFQTLVGAWPIDPDRLDEYLLKAMREAKRTTNWISPDEEWEDGVRSFARRLTSDEAFLADFTPVAARVAAAGAHAALAQVVLKLTCPGVPDIYQGDELELLALVDPDNRRPVDFGLRDAELRRLQGGGRATGATRKLWTIAQLLGLRARRPAPFAAGPSGRYEAIEAGERACAFVRGGEVLVIAELTPGAGGDLVFTPGGQWRDVLSGVERPFDAAAPVSEVAGEHGVAVYERL